MYIIALFVVSWELRIEGLSRRKDRHFFPYRCYKTPCYLTYRIAEIHNQHTINSINQPTNYQFLFRNLSKPTDHWSLTTKNKEAA